MEKREGTGITKKLAFKDSKFGVIALCIESLSVGTLILLILLNDRKSFLAHPLELLAIIGLLMSLIGLLIDKKTFYAWLALAVIGIPPLIYFVFYAGVFIIICHGEVDCFMGGPP